MNLVLPGPPGYSGLWVGGWGVGWVTTFPNSQPIPGRALVRRKRSSVTLSSRALNSPSRRAGRSALSTERMVHAGASRGIAKPIASKYVARRQEAALSARFLELDNSAGTESASSEIGEVAYLAPLAPSPAAAASPSALSLPELPDARAAAASDLRLSDLFRIDMHMLDELWEVVEGGDERECVELVPPPGREWGPVAPSSRTPTPPAPSPTPLAAPRAGSHTCPMAGCGMSYWSPKGVYQHKKAKHPWLVGRAAEQRGDAQGGFRFPCDAPGCDKVYASSQGVYQHRRNKHPALIKQRERGYERGPEASGRRAQPGEVVSVSA